MLRVEWREVLGAACLMAFVKVDASSLTVIVGCACVCALALEQAEAPVDESAAADVSSTGSD